LDLFVPEPGAFCVTDRAYLDVERLYLLHGVGSCFVTRAKRNLDARRVRSRARSIVAAAWCAIRAWR
jgi:hypothetical protein